MCDGHEQCFNNTHGVCGGDFLWWKTRNPQLWFPLCRPFVLHLGLCEVWSFFFCLYSARVREQMGSKRVPEHDNIMSLLIIASSQADSGAIVNSYNRGSSKERQKLWWGRSSCRNQQDQGGRRQLVRPRDDKHRPGQYWRMTSFTAQWHHNTVVMDFTIGVRIVSVKGTKKSQWIQ